MSQMREQRRLWVETWFRGIALMLVVLAVVFYPLYALIFKISPATLNQLIAPVTGIAGAVIGYWFGQASRRIQDSAGSSDQDRPEEEQQRLWVETWFRGIALMLVVLAVVFYPLYALIFNTSAATLAQVIAPVTGIAGAVIGYWFGQASRRIQDSSNSSAGGGA